MPNKANKFSKRGKFPTENAEVNPLPKEPHSALAVAVAVAVAVEVAAVARAVLKRKAVAVAKRVLAKRVVLRVRVQVKIIALQSIGLKLT